MQVESDWGNGCFWIKIDYGNVFQLNRQEIERLKADIEMAIHYYDEIEESARNHDEVE